MDSIATNTYFIPLSTCINAKGESERRFLTPFAIIEVIHRANKRDRRVKSELVVEMLDDTDIRIFFG